MKRSKKKLKFAIDQALRQEYDNMGLTNTAAKLRKRIFKAIDYCYSK